MKYKFKFWDKEDKKMIDGDRFVIRPESSLTPQAVIYDVNSLFNNPRYIPCEYIGEDDYKNEIYLGDFVTYTDYNDGETKLICVRWNEEDTIDWKGCKTASSKILDGYNVLCGSFSMNIKKVGNIFENADLYFKYPNTK